MTNKILSFNKINLIKTAGFDPPGFSVEGLKSQINIVYGPNAVGKTTLARAFSYLIWPEALAPDNTITRGNFDLNGSKWFAKIDSGKFSYQRDGSVVSRPPFPPAEHRDRYYVALHDLLQKTTDDRSFVETIIRESAGGYQISEAVEQLGYKDDPSRKGKTTRRVRKKIKKYFAARKKQEELEEEERSLQRLYRELDRIKEARKQLEIVKQAIEVSKANEKYREIEAKYNRFPPAMSEVTGNEEDELEKIKANIRNYRNKKKKAKEKFDRAQQILSEVELPAGGIEESFLTKLKNKKEKLKNQEERIEQFKTKLEEAKARRKEERKNFIELIHGGTRGDEPGKDLSKIDSGAYNELSDFARRAERVHNRFSSLENLKELLKMEEELPAPENVVEDGIRYLEDWLRVPDRKVIVEKQRKIRNISLLSSLIISLLSIFIGFSINPLFSLFIIVAGGIIWYGLREEQEDHNYRSIAREKYGQLNLEVPEKWKRTAVEVRLKELSTLNSEIKLIKKNKQYWASKEKEYQELQKAKDKIDKRREKLIECYGVAPDTDEQTLYYLTNRLSRWQDAHTSVQALLKKLEASEALYKKLLAEINENLTEYGYCQAADMTEVSGFITELEERNNRFQVAVRDKQKAKETEEEVNKDLQQAEKKRKELFARLNLKPGDETTLRELCNSYQDYIKIKEKLSNIKHLCQREKEKLEKFSDFERSLLENDLAELKERKRELEIKAEEYESIQGKISEIEAKITAAKETRNVEEALTEKERALDELENDLDRDYEQLVGKVMADYVREVNTTENRPEVFRQAREIFSDITRGNYELEVDNSEDPSFRAIETVTGKGKHLNELSSGTRIQLLLAVRMAFVDWEENISLPLYLDETLANADDRKAEAIIRSVIELSRKGRQCFYFTAQKDEVRKWQGILAREPGVESKVIDLEKSKGVKKSNEGDKISLFSGLSEIISNVGQISAADGMSHEEYGKELSISAFNPRLGAKSAHLWYLVEDPKLVEHFLKLGIKNWGQLKTLLKTGKDGFISEEKKKALKEIQELGSCLEEFVKCWQIGRGEPVDRSVLLQSGAVSDNFIDEVSELAEEVKGDAEAISSQLREGAVSNFLTRKIDALEQYFEEEGYIDMRNTLSGEQIRARMLGVLSLDNLEEAGEKVNRLIKRLEQG